MIKIDPNTKIPLDSEKKKRFNKEKADKLQKATGNHKIA
jgi:hypothetical protein